MTTRPGNAALQLMRRHHAQRRCSLIDIIRRDGFTLRTTDHDCYIRDADGNDYRPMQMSALSADRREAAFRAGNQEAYGVISDTFVQIDDLHGNLYRGAEVRIRKVDWSDPRIVFAAHRKVIRSVNWSGRRWTATLEGRTQQLERASAGRFGGTFTTTCPYELGGPFCKRQLYPWRQWGLNVNWFSSGATWNTLVDVVQTWTPNQWAGFRLFTYGIGPGLDQKRTIISNTVNTLTIDKPWSVLPTNTGYVIGKGPRVQTVIDPYTEVEFYTADFYWGDLIAVDDAYRDGSIEWVTGDNAGIISPIESYGGATRRCKILIPTPFPIQANDQGVVEVGCDGLIGTCREKFANVVNFGGDPFAPSGQKIVEPPDA